MATKIPSSTSGGSLASFEEITANDLPNDLDEDVIVIDIDGNEREEFYTESPKTSLQQKTADIAREHISCLAEEKKTDENLLSGNLKLFL